MTLSDKYKKAMDNIMLSDELKSKIIENANSTKKNNKIKSIYRISSGIAACVAVLLIAVTVFYTNKIDIDEENPGNVFVGNPMVEVKSIEEARKSVDFEVLVPQKLPKDYEISDIYVINNEIVEIEYKNTEESKIIYRTQKGTEDCSGDYTQYSTEEKIQINGSDVVLKSNMDSKTLAIWINNKMSYACTFPQEMSKEEIINIIENIK